MKAFEIHGGNGTYLQLEDGRFADTVIGDTTEALDPHDALEALRREVDDAATKPFYGDWTVAELAEYVGIDKPSWGGRREGAGRKPRTDNRTWRIVKIPLTDAEFEAVKAISPDQRRDILLAAPKFSH